MLLLAGCTHHDTVKDAEHHHHDKKDKATFEGKCAYSVAHNEFDVDGKNEFTLQHAGVTYFFSSEEKKNDFEKDLDKNLNSARQNWDRRSIK